MEVTVKDRQTVFDISVQCLGGVTGVFALAERNGISITARLKDGMILAWDHSDVVDATVCRTYSERGIMPATDIEVKEMQALLGVVSSGGGSDVTDPADTVVVDKIDQIIADLAAGKEVVSESDLSLTRIFDNPFDVVFA